MPQVNSKKSNKNIAEDLCKFDKETLFRLLDSGILKITPMRVTRGVFDKENLDKIQGLIDQGLIEILPNKLDSKNTYEDWISIIKLETLELEKTVSPLVNCPDTEEAWGKLSEQGRALDQLIRDLQKIRRIIYSRCSELHDIFEEPIKKSISRRGLKRFIKDENDPTD